MTILMPVGCHVVDDMESDEKILPMYVGGVVGYGHLDSGRSQWWSGGTARFLPARHFGCERGWESGNADADTEAARYGVVIL
jgi:hypothetical protein